MHGMSINAKFIHIHTSRQLQISNLPSTIVVKSWSVCNSSAWQIKQSNDGLFHARFYTTN